MRTQHSGRSRRSAPDPALVGAVVLLAGAVALAVGALNLLAGVGGVPPDWVPRPILEPLPDPGLPLAWTDHVLVPGVRSAVGGELLLRLLAALGTGAVAVWALGGAVLLRSRGARLQGEYRLHRAVGAAAGQLHRTAAREAGGVAGAALLLGVPLGGWAGGQAAGAWPGWIVGFRDAGVPIGLLLVVPVALIPFLAAGRAVREALGPGRLDLVPPPGLGPLLPMAQFAVAVALLHTGGLLAQRVEVPDVPGFRPASTLEGPLAFADGTSESRRGLLLERALDELEALDGIRAASIASVGTSSGIGIEDVVVTRCGACSMAGLPTPLKPVLATHHAVSPDTFTILGLHLEEGRGLTPADRAGQEAVAVVSRSLARDHFDAGGPLGRRIRVGRAPGQWVRVVGVVEDRLPLAPDVSPEPEQAVYLSALQFPPERVEVVVVTGGAGAPPSLGVWEVRWRTDPAVTFAGLVAPPPAGSVQERALRWFGRMARMMGWLALAGATFGLAAVLAHRVEERSPELALRRAVGARRGRVVGEVLGEALRIVLGGMAAGIWLVLLVSGLARQWMEGLPLVEPGPLGAILSAMAVAACAGALGPALRAARISPARGLTRE